MDPILSIIKYIFHQYEKENHDDTLNSFFDNGISFPTFISLIFENDGISGVIEHPENIHDKESNNNIALKFLYQNSKIFENEKYNLNTEENRKKLILDIITKQYFKISQELIIEKSNLIIQPTKSKTLNIIDIIKPHFLLSLLFVLTDGNTENPNSIKSNENIYSCLQASFEKAKIPYFLNQCSFDISNEDLFLIQIQIVFNVFNVKTSGEGKISQNPSEVSEESIESTSEKEIKKIKRKKEIENEDKFILKLINVLGINGGFKFEDFLHLIQNDNLPRYVMYYLQISSIENVILSDTKPDKITRKIIKNINAVIEFMKKKEKKFEVLLFNFKNPLMRENSTKLFFRHFLNTFFLKISKKKLYERCATLLCRKFEFKDDTRFSDLNNLGHFLGLLHFVNEGNLNFDYRKLSSFDEQSVKQLFKKAKVPRLINKEVLKNFNSFEISQDLVFYQLQLIFNKIDSAPASRRIIEAFLKGYQLLKNVQVPDKDVLAASIEAKRKFIEYQKKHKNEEEEIEQSTNENLNNKENENLDISEFEIKNDDDDDDESQTETDEDNDKNDANKYVDPEIFWNPPDTNIGLDNGILFNSSEEFQDIADEENFDDYPDDFALLENAFSIDENWIEENKTQL